MRAVDTLTAVWSAETTNCERRTINSHREAMADPLIRVKSLLLLLAPDVEIELLAAELHMSSALGMALAQRAMLDRELPTWREDLIGVRYDHINKTCQIS